VGGYITEEYSWPWVFYFNIPFAAVLVAGIILFVPATQKGQPRPFDWFGFAALAIALTAFQVVLARGELHDWFSSTEIIVEAAIALLALYVLVVHTATAPHPFLDPRIFKDRNVVLGLLFIFSWAMTVNAPLVLLSLRLQTVDNMPVSLVGLLMSPRGFGGILAMSLVGRVLARVNPKPVIVFGFCMIAAAAWIMSTWPPNASTWEVSLAGFILGIGVACAYVSLTVIAFSTVATQLRAEAVSFYSLTLNMGSGIGIAVSVIIVSQGIQANHEILSHNITLFSDLLRGHALPHY
jgi:DHA2 family multidrug resistance protein